MVFLLFFPVFILTSFQQEAFCEPLEESLGKIQWHAITNAKSNRKYAKSEKIVLMGAFTTSEEPAALPISLDFEYETYKEFYMGIVIVNNSGSDKDIRVTFELSGPRSGKEKEDVTLPADYTYIAYIKDVFGRPGFYTFTGSVKDVGSSTVKMLFTR